MASIDAVLQSLNVDKINQTHPLMPNASKRKIGDNELAKIYTVYYNANDDPGEVSGLIMNKNKGILDWAEPDYVMVSQFTPNDPSTGSQWFLSKISAYSAWDLSQGDTNVVIGMVDTGSDLDHPDLAANIKRNWLENPTNGIDDDGNGYIDDWRGWDFAGANYLALSQDNDPSITTSYCEHGSHTSGCASEVSNNGVGGAGIGFKCKLLISKHGADNDNTSSGSSYLYNTNSGLVYVYQNGAKVINCSYGGSTYSAYTQLVMNNAFANGTVAVAAAGNDGTNVAMYPAAYNNVISVAASTSSDTKAYFSNYNTTVDVTAPGQGIYSTLWNNTYASWDGTSMASPITAGIVALIWSKFPAYTPDQVVAKLKAGVDDIYSVNPSYVGLLGTGRVNAFKCLQGGTPIIENTNEVPVKFSIEQNYPNPFNPVTNIKFALPKSSIVKLSVYDVSGKEVAALLNEFKKSGTYIFQFDASSLSSGVYFYKISADNFTDTKRMILIK